MEKRYLMQDRETGLTVSVPEDRMEYFQKQQENPEPMDEETSAKFDRAWELVRKRFYGK